MGELLKYISIFILTIVILIAMYDALAVCYPRITGLRWSLPSQILQRSVFPRCVHPQITCNPYFQISVSVLLNRAILIVFASLVYSFLENKPIDILGNYAAVWFKWDTRHFLYLAEHGYPSEGEFKTLLVYYPMYPLLIRGMNLLVGDYFTSALLVSFICLVVSSFVLFKLSLREFGDKQISKDSVKYLLLFPMSIFATMAYTESTFLMFSVLSFYFIRKQSFWVAGAFGGLAALTRNQGVLLVAPLVYESVRVAIESKRSGNRIGVAEFGKIVLPPLLIMGGLFAYLWLNKSVSGDWFRFLEYQRTNWGQEVMFFADNVANIYYRIGDGSTTIAMGTWIPSVAVFVFSLVMVTVMRRVLPTAYVVYCVPFLIISYSPSWLLSGARYMFVVFPFYMVLARLLAGRRQLTHCVESVLLFSTMLICMAFIRLSVY